MKSQYCRIRYYGLNMTNRSLLRVLLRSQPELAVIHWLWYTQPIMGIVSTTAQVLAEFP